MSDAVTSIIDLIGLIIDTLNNMRITNNLSVLTFLIIMLIVVLVVSWIYERWTK